MQKVVSYILLKSHYKVYDTLMTQKERQLSDYQWFINLQGRSQHPF